MAGTGRYLSSIYTRSHQLTARGILEPLAALMCLKSFLASGVRAVQSHSASGKLPVHKIAFTLAELAAKYYLITKQHLSREESGEEKCAAVQQECDMMRICLTCKNSWYTQSASEILYSLCTHNQIIFFVWQSIKYVIITRRERAQTIQVVPPSLPFYRHGSESQKY